jgi:hypothetical protein
MAIAAVTGLSAPHPEYQVVRFTQDSLGYLVSVMSLGVRAQHADTLEVTGGGALVRVWRGDSVTVLKRYFY